MNSSSRTRSGPAPFPALCLALSCVAAHRAAAADIVVTDASITGFGNATTQSESLPHSLNLTGFPLGGSSGASAYGYTGNPPATTSTAIATSSGTGGVSGGFFSTTALTGVEATSTSALVNNQYVFGDAQATTSTRTRVVFHVETETVLYQSDRSASAWSAAAGLNESPSVVSILSCECRATFSGPGLLMQRSFRPSGADNFHEYWPQFGTAVRLLPFVDYTIDIQCDGLAAAQHGGRATVRENYGMTWQVLPGAAATFSSQPSDLQICSASDAEFTVTAAGAGPPSYRWQYQGVGSPTWSDLPDGAASYGFTAAGTHTPHLILHPVGSFQSGLDRRFRCVLQNGYGDVISDAASLTVCACLTCPADFNQDGGIDGGDVNSFFTAWDIGNCDADVNSDGGVDGADLDTFFGAWESGAC
ncbi:MAG: hypothetical protein JSR77_11060 [Planctomycetes bacterium]|nr:hypothetical protein [Planctomycetota bacterium]